MKKDNEVVIPISLIMVKCQWWLSALTIQINRVEKNMNSCYNGCEKCYCSRVGIF